MTKLTAEQKVNRVIDYVKKQNLASVRPPSGNNSLRYDIDGLCYVLLCKTRLDTSDMTLSERRFMAKVMQDLNFKLKEEK